MLALDTPITAGVQQKMLKHLLHEFMDEGTNNQQLSWSKQMKEGANDQTNGKMHK